VNLGRFVGVTDSRCRADTEVKSIESNQTSKCSLIYKCILPNSNTMPLVEQLVAEYIGSLTCTAIALLVPWKYYKAITNNSVHCIEFVWIVLHTTITLKIALKAYSGGTMASFHCLVFNGK